MQSLDWLDTVPDFRAPVVLPKRKGTLTEGERRARKRIKARFADLAAGIKGPGLTARAIEYARWLAARDGIDLSRAMPEYDFAHIMGVVHPDGVTRKHVSAVVFTRVEPERNETTRIGRNRWRTVTIPAKREEIATILIPNWDFVPTVIDLSE